MSDHSEPTFLAPDPTDLAPHFPAYEIQHLIATGGMGAVYKAVQKSLERTVAIKILPHEFGSDESFKNGFEAEARVMARLNHPNLIGVFDSGEVAGMLFIIMEYVPCGSLFQASHGSAIDPTEVVRLVTAICRGLAHAHDNGIIHRDIKPANILLDQNTNPKIGDFGLARPVERGLQEGEEIFGTPNYTAPEVVHSPYNVDHRADIFSLGVLLHELLTGQLPTEDSRPASAIIGCDPRFDAVIRRATDPDPMQRYASALDIEKQLLTISTTAGPRAMKVSSPQAGSRTASNKAPLGMTKKKSGVPVLGLFLILTVGVGYIFRDKIIELSKPLITRNQSGNLPAATNSNMNQSSTDPIAASQNHPEATHTDPFEDLLNTPSDDDPAPTESAEFDANEFMQSARSLVHNRYEANATIHADALVTNSAEFVQSLENEASKISDNESLEKIQESIAAVVSDTALNQGKISSSYSGFDDLDEFEKIHTAFIEKQGLIDQEFATKLSKVATLYAVGIQNKIDHLDEKNEADAIQLLQGELTRLREEPNYFVGLMSVK